MRILHEIMTILFDDVNEMQNVGRIMKLANVNIYATMLSKKRMKKRWGFWNISIAQVFWNWIRKNHVTGALILRCPNNVRIRHRHLRNRWNNVLMSLFFYLSDGQSSNKFSWINNLCLLLYYQSDWNNSNSSARNMDIYGFWTAKNVITSPFGKKYLRTFRNMLLLSRHLSISRFGKLFQAIHKT